MPCLPSFSSGALVGGAVISGLLLSSCGGGGGGKYPPQGAASLPAPAATSAAPAPAPVPSNKPIVEYTIQSGDSLWKIARAYETTVREIKDANQMTSDMIVAGQTLRVPSGLGEGVEPGTPAAPAMPSAGPQGLPQPAVVDSSSGLVQ